MQKVESGTWNVERKNKSLKIKTEKQKKIETTGWKAES